MAWTMQEKVEYLAGELGRRAGAAWAERNNTGWRKPQDAALLEEINGAVAAAEPDLFWRISDDGVAGRWFRFGFIQSVEDALGLDEGTLVDDPAPGGGQLS